MLFEQAPTEGKKISLPRSRFLGLSLCKSARRKSPRLLYLLSQLPLAIAVVSLSPHARPKNCHLWKGHRKSAIHFVHTQTRDNLIGREFEVTSLRMYRNLDLGTKDCRCLTKEELPLANVISSYNKLRPPRLAFVGGDGLYLCICSDYLF